MHGFNWFDRRGTEGMPLVKTLRTLLTNNVPEILPEIRMAVSELFDLMHDSHPVAEGENDGICVKTAADDRVRCQSVSVVLNDSRSCRLFQCASILWNRARCLNLFSILSTVQG